MTVKYDSISERKAAPKIAALGGQRCESFAPLLSDWYTDAEGVELKAKPDSLIPRGGGYTFLDTKSGVLNNHYTRASSHEALKRGYGEVFGRCGDHLSHHELSTALYGHSEQGRIIVRAHAFNHSVFKLAAIQAKHGWQRFLVVFDRNPTGLDAERYCKAGLVFCNLKSLPDFLQNIELMRHGFFIPSQFISKNYSLTVTPELSTKGLSHAQVEMIDRGRYLAAIAIDKAAVASQKAKYAADEAAGIQPF
jgi:hypothetical protein